MQIAYTQYGRGLGQMTAKLRPELQPAVEGGAEKRELRFRLVLVLEGEILPNDRELPGQPVLEIGSCFEDIHAELKGFRDGLYVCVFGSSWTDLEARLINREFRGKFRDLFAHALLDLCLADVREDFRDPAADQFHLRFAHAARGDGRATQPDPATLHGRERIERNRILIYGNARTVEGFFGVRPSDAARVHFDQEQMVVRAARYDAKPMLRNGRGHGIKDPTNGRRCTRASSGLAGAEARIRG